MKNHHQLLLCAVLLAGCYQMATFDDGSATEGEGHSDTGGEAGDEGDEVPSGDGVDEKATDTGTDTATASDSPIDTGSATEIDTDTGVDTENDTDTDTGTDTGVSSTVECLGQGLWLDEKSGLCWGGGAPKVPWCEAGRYCDELDAGDHDDWRLPTIDELRTLVRGCPGTERGGACRVVDGSDIDDWSADCMGCDCPGAGGWARCCWEPALGNLCGWVCSSSVFHLGLDYAWCVNFASGHVYYKEVDCDDTPFIGSFETGCVRG